MDNRVIAERYELVETLFSNELQTSYLARLAGSDGSKQFIINEFRDTDIIYSMKDSFSREKCRYIRNMVETFYENFCFYVVCSICSGPVLETYLSTNNLRLTEKMYLTESLFTQLVEMEALSPFIVFSLCDTDNLTVTNKRNICFNCNLRLTDEKMSADKTVVSKRVGEILCAIFSNTVEADLNYAKDNMPPALFSITQNCLEGKYETMAAAYSDFKASLLYSVFMGSGSVDNQIRKNYNKAKIRRRLTPVRRLAAIAAVLLVVAGIWSLVRNLDIYTTNSGTAGAQNTNPTAQFTANKEQATVGDTVIFVNQASDPDSNDSIKAYSWEISKEDKTVLSSTNSNIACKFIETGKYTVSLTVTDTRDGMSEPFTMYINVLPKPIVSTSGSGSGGENNK